MDPSTGCVFGCCTPSLSVNSFPTPLILDAICNSFSGLSYLCGASQACPVPALLSVYHNCTSVKNKLSSIDLPSCRLHNVGLFTSCNSAHAAVLWCPCLYCTVLCLVYICMWAVMSTIDVHCIRVSFKVQTARHAHDLVVQLRQRNMKLKLVEYVFVLPNAAWREGCIGKLPFIHPTVISLLVFVWLARSSLSEGTACKSPITKLLMGIRGDLLFPIPLSLFAPTAFFIFQTELTT